MPRCLWMPASYIRRGAIARDCQTCWHPVIERPALRQWNPQLLTEKRPAHGQFAMFVGFRHQLLLDLVHRSSRTGQYAAHAVRFTSKIRLFAGFVENCLLFLTQLWYSNDAHDPEAREDSMKGWCMSGQDKLIRRFVR